QFCVTSEAPLEWKENITKLPITQLNFSPEGTGSCAKQELQALWEKFTSWLQPEKQSKEQMISQLVLEQFIKIGHCKDRSVLKEQWELSGRNIGRFMESLTDECLKPPVMIHVSMLGEEALFSENMSLKEVIKLLKLQKFTRTSKEENKNTPLSISQDMVLMTGHEKSENGQNNLGTISEVNVIVHNPGNEMDSLSTTQKERFYELEEGGGSDGVSEDYRRTNQATSRNQEESQWVTSSEYVPTVEIHSFITSRDYCQNHSTNCTYAGHQK
ncbi:zinc finger protein and SCAN domain containing protein 4C-like, partial [Sigmodon hispidus]